MKTLLRNSPKLTSPALFAGLMILFLGLAVVGCASAPTKLEKKLFDVQTNRVEEVVVVTNVIPVYVTNEAAVEVVHYETNRVWATNIVEAYTFTPNTNATALSQTVARTAGFFGPFGDLAGVIVGGVFGLWGYLRSSRATKTAGVLAQVIETGRQVLQSTPQGQALDDRWKSWMIQHQAEQGVISDVVRLVGNVVDNETAKEAAAKLLGMMEERSK